MTVAAVDADLVIVGGGPAGLSLSLFLAARDPALLSRTVLLERDHYPREKICAGAIAGHALSRLAAIGAIPDVPHVKVRGLAATTRFGHVEVRSDAVMGWVVRRVEFDAALAGLARARGLDLREGCAVESITQTDDGRSRLVLRDGSKLRANMVVGADGVGSVVRRTLHFPKGPILARAVEVDTERARHDHQDDLLHFDLTAADLRGYAWDFPTPLGGAVKVCRGVYDLGPPAVDPTERLLARDQPPPLSKPRRFGERGLTLGQPHGRGNTLLIGEAAGIDPVLGEGIAQAILYGEMAAAVISARQAASGPRFDDVSRFLLRGRLGLDLHVRGRATRFVYGKTRNIVERTMVADPALARAGLAYFGGRHVARSDLAKAFVSVLLGRRG